MEMDLDTPVNEQTYHLKVSNRRRLWTLETPEALQGCWGIGDWEDWERGSWASGNLTHSTKHNASCLTSVFGEAVNIDAMTRQGVFFGLRAQQVQSIFPGGRGEA
uniref:SFRICE_022620 n=1 Tax=Spodoptera frugiperda TaxID=7108 RepID=A0A2H1VGE9_SPOFR